MREVEGGGGRNKVRWRGGGRNKVRWRGEEGIR